MPALPAILIAVCQHIANGFAFLPPRAEAAHDGIPQDLARLERRHTLNPHPTARHGFTPCLLFEPSKRIASGLAQIISTIGNWRQRKMGYPWAFLQMCEISSKQAQRYGTALRRQRSHVRIVS